MNLQFQLVISWLKNYKINSEASTFLNSLRNTSTNLPSSPYTCLVTISGRWRKENNKSDVLENHRETISKDLLHRQYRNITDHAMKMENEDIDSSDAQMTSDGHKASSKAAENMRKYEKEK